MTTVQFLKSEILVWTPPPCSHLVLDAGILFALELPVVSCLSRFPQKCPLFPAETLTQVKSEDFGPRSPDASELGWSSSLLHLHLPFLWCTFSKFNVSESPSVCCSRYLHTYLSAQMSKSSRSSCLNLSCWIAHSCLSSSRSKNEAERRGYLTKYSAPCFQTQHQWEPPLIVQWLALVQICPKSGETLSFRRASLVRAMLPCSRGCQIPADRKRAGRAGFCSLILSIVAGEGKPLVWSLLLCITSTLPLMYCPIHFQWIKISDNLGTGTKRVGFTSHYPEHYFGSQLFDG